MHANRKEFSIPRPGRVKVEADLKRSNEKKVFSRPGSCQNHLDEVHVLIQTGQIYFGQVLQRRELHVEKTSSTFNYSQLVISTLIISNNRLSRRENQVLVLTQKSKIRL